MVAVQHLACQGNTGFAHREIGLVRTGFANSFCFVGVQGMRHDITGEPLFPKVSGGDQFAFDVAHGKDDGFNRRHVQPLPERDVLRVTKDHIASFPLVFFHLCRIGVKRLDQWLLMSKLVIGG